MKRISPHGCIEKYFSEFKAACKRIAWRARKEPEEVWGIMAEDLLENPDNWLKKWKHNDEYSERANFRWFCHYRGFTVFRLLRDEEKSLVANQKGLHEWLTRLEEEHPDEKQLKQKRKDDKEKCSRLIGKLNEEQRDFLLLRAFEGLNIKEAQERLGWTDGQITYYYRQLRHSKRLEDALYGD